MMLKMTEICHSGVVRNLSAYRNRSWTSQDDTRYGVGVGDGDGVGVASA